MASYISEHKSLSAGAGVSILTTIAGIFSSYLKAHPAWLYAGGIVGAVLLLWPLLHSLLVRQNNNEANTSNSDVQSRPDNWSHQVTNAPGGTIIIGDRNTAVSRSEHSIAVPVLEARPETISLELNLELRSIVYDCPSSAWRLATQFDHRNSKIALIAWFTNPVPPKGTRSINASGLTAHLQFTGSLPWNEQVEQAYWLGKSENRINLGGGNRAGVVVGLVEWNNWVCYLNPYERPAHEEFLQPAFHPLGERKSMPKSPMDIHVSLISSDAITLEAREIRLGFRGNGDPYAEIQP